MLGLQNPGEKETSLIKNEKYDGASFVDVNKTNQKS